MGECERCGELDDLERVYAPIGKELCRDCIQDPEIIDRLIEDSRR